ncbi:MAG: translation initiation factor IF-2 [Promethearchaeota archaeon]
MAKRTQKKPAEPGTPGGKRIRSPIVCVLGHIDHGKTSILDYIRGTVVQQREAAGITQHIGASFFPMEDIRQFCGEKYAGIKLSIPGLLIIDTPGHAAFMNLRSRGGAVADIAILVIDVTAGAMPITWEAVRILRDRKVPFIIAANKIDRIPGWKSVEKADFLTTYEEQAEYVRRDLDERVYTMMGDFYEEGFPGCDRYDKITDFTKNIAIVPTSAKTGEGIPTLLMVLSGLAQQFLQENIKFSEGPARGVVLEVKNEPGYGVTLDSLIYDGVLKKGDPVIFGGLDHPVNTRIRALLLPKPLDEIRDPRKKFDSVDELYAAAGVKILAADVESVVAGAPFRGYYSQAQEKEVLDEIEEELHEIQISTDTEGVVLKADTLGSLEALVSFLRKNSIKIRRAGVGAITRKDVMEATTVRETDPLSAVILAFNVKPLKDAEKAAFDMNIRIFSSDVIYRLLEDYQEYLEKRRAEETAAALDELVFPGKVEHIPEYIFRKSNPVVIGVRVLKGKIAAKVKVVRGEDAKKVGRIHQIQDKGKSVKVAGAGEEVAISINKVTLGRQLKEGDTLFVEVPEGHARLLKNRYYDDLEPDVQDALDEYIKLMREHRSSYWGM